MRSSSTANSPVMTFIAMLVEKGPDVHGPDLVHGRVAEVGLEVP